MDGDPINKIAVGFVTFNGEWVFSLDKFEQSWKIRVCEKIHQRPMFLTHTLIPNKTFAFTTAKFFEI